MHPLPFGTLLSFNLFAVSQAVCARLAATREKSRSERQFAHQDKPYALFGTCLGAIVAYEIAQRARARGMPPPVALVPAAVSPPHLYALAVAKLYLAPGEQLQGEGLLAEIIEKLRGWRELPRETLMLVRRQTLRFELATGRVRYKYCALD